MKPTIGRIVHYYESPKGILPNPPLAAVVTHVYGAGEETMVCLTVFPPFSSPYARTSIQYSESPAPGCWSWPPRVA